MYDRAIRKSKEIILYVFVENIFIPLVTSFTSTFSRLHTAWVIVRARLVSKLYYFIYLCISAVFI